MTDIDLTAAIRPTSDAIYRQLSGQYGDFSTPSDEEAEAVLKAALPHILAQVEARVHELHMARQTVLSVRTDYDKGGVRLDAVRTFAADWEDVQAHNREAFSRGRIGYTKDAPTLDRLQAILNGGAA